MEAGAEADKFSSWVERAESIFYFKFSTVPNFCVKSAAAVAIILETSLGQNPLDIIPLYADLLNDKSPPDGKV